MNRQLQMGTILAAAVWSFAPMARADVVDAALTESVETGNPGQTVAFYATVTNPSSTDTVYLNGDSFSTSTPLLTLDDGPFYANAPLFLAPGGSSGPFEMFDVGIDPSMAPGTYSGNFFSILGGRDDATFNDLVDVPFSVKVEGATAATPEPATSWFLVIPLIAFEALRRRRHSGKIMKD
jgi:hypothetical protein